MLGAIIHANQALQVVSGWVQPHMFFSPGHREIFTAMLELWEDRDGEHANPIDETSLGHRLESKGKLEFVGGLIYIAELVDLTPVGSNIAIYADIVVDTHSRRQEINAAKEFLDAGGGEKKAGALRFHLGEIAVAGASRKATTLREMMLAARARLEERSSREACLIQTYTDLDPLINGLTPGYVTVVAARTSNGKSAFTSQIAVENARHGIPVLMVTLEMSEVELAMRMISFVSGVNGTKLLKGSADDLTAREWDLIAWGQEKLAEAPLFFIGNGRALNLDQIGNACRKFVFREGVKLVVIDHLRKIAVPDAGFRGIYEQQTRRIEYISDLAKELDIPFLVAAQINRESSDKPSIKDIEGSGIIEQEADVVFLLHLPEEHEDRIDVHAGKVRNGRRFSRTLTWQGPHYRIGPNMWGDPDQTGMDF